MWRTPVLVGTLLRAALAYGGFTASVAASIELTSPISSQRRAVEAAFLRANGLSMYQGGVYHQTPLLPPLLDAFGAGLPLAFIAIDVAVAVLLFRISCAVQSGALLHRNTSVAGKAPTARSADNLPNIVAALYMLNPFTMAACVALTSTSLNHVFICACVHWALARRPVAAGAAFAAAVLLDLYPLLLLPAVVLMLLQHQQQRHQKLVDGNAAAAVFVASAVSWIALLLWISFEMNARSWCFLAHTYGFMFEVPDLTPNIGVFWYFVTEIFDRFRALFLFCFHGHILVYWAPLVCRLWRTPTFLMYTLVAIPAIFRAYPVISDAAFAWILLTMHWSLLGKMRRMLPVFVAMAVIATLAVLMWHLWIVLGSGNANFYYFQTIAFNLLQCVVLTEAIASVRKVVSEMDAPLQ